MGKGSARRNEDINKVWDNWDQIFGKKEKVVEEETTMDNKEPESEESKETK